MNKILSLIITILLFSNSYSQCGQHYENMIESLTDVRFWDENNGFVAGGSTLLTTNDGGVSWSKHLVPTTNNAFNDIELFGTNKAFTFGPDGVVFFTDNKGVNWERRIIGNNGIKNYKGANFITNSLGYLVGINDYLDEETAFLYKTINGGESWSEVSSNISTLISGNFTPNDIFFLNENLGFLWGGSSLFKTVNGGETWESLGNPTNSNINKLQFIDLETAYLSSGSSIYKSTDGGVNWIDTGYYVEWTTGAFTVQNEFLYYSSYAVNGMIRVPINGGAEESASINQDGFPTDISFINDTVGFAVGKKEQFSYGMGRFIYKTIDAGLNWVQLDSGSPLEGSSTKAAYFKKINENDYVYSVLTGGGYTHSSVLLSQDNGASWKKVYGTEDVIGYTLFAEGDYISHWRYSNPNNGGDGYIISETNDKGITWVDGPTHQLSDLPPNTFLEGFLFQVSLDDLFINNYSELFHSTDKGATWTLVSTPSGIVSHKYQFIDENKFIIYARNSTTEEPMVYHTLNGGDDWDLVANLSGYSHNIQFDKSDYSHPDKIYIYPRYPGDKLFIYDVPNQNLIETDISFIIYNIKAIDDDSFIVKGNGGLNISHDNGLTWTERSWEYYNSNNPNIYVENEDNIFLWDYNFIQNLKKYIPSEPELISGNDYVLINTEEEYVIPLDMFSDTEWVLESGGTLILENDTSHYKAKVLWETEGVHTLKAKKINECGESIFTEIDVTVVTELGAENFNIEQIIVYPNPFNDKISISLPKKFENNILSITITNMLGQLVYKKEQNYTSQIIELKNIPKSINSGIYFIKVEADKSFITKKIIKK